MGNCCSFCKRKKRFADQGDMDSPLSGTCIESVEGSEGIQEEDVGNSPPSYTPVLAQPKRRLRRSKRIAQRRVRERGLVLDAVEAFMEPRRAL